MNTTELEAHLRNAPRPAPPPGLKEQLKAQAPLAVHRAPTPARALPPNAGSWLARWWPALAPAAVSLACAAVLTVQQSEIQRLKEALPPPPATPGVEVSAAPADSSDSGAVAARPAGQDQAELERLRALADGLSNGVSRLEQIQTENDHLRKQLAAAATRGFSPEETQAMEAARQKALAIQCVNNLKQLCLAVKIWQVDHDELTPTQLLQMTNEMTTPKILFCPADTARQAAADWASYSAGNCSYEYLTPGAKNPETEPERLMFRCPIHGSIGLTDGSVQMGIGKTHPEWIVQRDGKLYFERTGAPAANPGQ